MPIIDEILRKIKDFPPLSQSASKLMQLIGDPDRDVQHVVHIVECDAALTSRVLRVVNSASLSLMNPITSVARAVSYLGYKTVLSIALEASTAGIFMRPLDGYEAGRGALWDHDLRTAIASREMAGLGKEKLSQDLAFTGGLLHDIGKVVLSEFLRESSGDILSEIDGGKVEDYLSAEQERLGIDHAMIGYKLARLWGLPIPLPDIIRHHHNPAQGDADIRPYIYAVHLGDIIAMMGGTGTGSDDMQCRLDEGFTDYIHVSLPALEKVMLQVDKEFTKTKSSIFGEKENDQ